MTESVDANLRNVMPPTMQTVGNVKSLKHDGSHEMVIQPRSSSGYTTRRIGRPKKQVLAIEDKQLALEDRKYKYLSLKIMPSRISEMTKVKVSQLPKEVPKPQKQIKDTKTKKNDITFYQVKYTFK